MGVGTPLPRFRYSPTEAWIPDEREQDPLYQNRPDIKETTPRPYPGGDIFLLLTPRARGRPT
jgi:hypothetical protein